MIQSVIALRAVIEEPKVEWMRKRGCSDPLELAREGHSLWLEIMERSGYHRPSFCQSFGKGCDKCRSEMVAYDELPAETRARLIRAVRALQEKSSEVLRGARDVHHSDLTLLIDATIQETAAYPFRETK